MARVSGTDNVAITTTSDLSGTVSVGDRLAVGGWGDFDVVDVNATTITIADEHGTLYPSLRTTLTIVGKSTCTPSTQAFIRLRV